MARKKLETPEERIDDALKTSNGTVPMVVALDDAEALERAKKHLKGRKGSKLLRLVTRKQLDAEWADLKAAWAKRDLAQPDQKASSDRKTGTKPRKKKKEAA